MSWLSKARCALRFAILLAGYVPRCFTTSWASPFAVQAATFPFLAWTLTFTSGLICAPVFDDEPVATACVEIPFLNAETFAWQRFATVFCTDRDCTTAATADGFV